MERKTAPRAPAPFLALAVYRPAKVYTRYTLYKGYTLFTLYKMYTMYTRYKVYTIFSVQGVYTIQASRGGQFLQSRDLLALVYLCIQSDGDVVSV